MNTIIEPIEKTDPDLAEFIRGVVNKEKPCGVKSFSISRNGDLYVKTDTVHVEKINRNEPCPYCLKNGIEIKYKKCKEHNKA
jgi:hypothetical protein